MSDIEQVMAAKFRSGNDVPVTSARISLKEWQQLQAQLKRLQGESKKKCSHKNTEAKWDYVVCLDCANIFTGYSEEWGAARAAWFENLEQAKFYKANGFLPTPPRSDKPTQQQVNGE